MIDVAQHTTTTTSHTHTQTQHNSAVVTVPGPSVGSQVESVYGCEGDEDDENDLR